MPKLEFLGEYLAEWNGHMLEVSTQLNKLKEISERTESLRGYL